MKNVSENLETVNFLAKCLNSSDAVEFELPKLLENYSSNEEDFIEEYSEEIELLKTIKENLKNDDSFYFEYDGMEFRIIAEKAIDAILKEEIVDNEIIPYFNADFLANILDVPKKEIELCQEHNCTEIIMKLAETKIDEIVEGYVSADSYGNHFSHYDGYEHSFQYFENDFYIFRTN